jgi:chromosome partitioning protein
MTDTGPRADPNRSPLVVALMNQKGGVGKTTTTVNLAAGLASIGMRALVVDLDPQAHATLHLGVDPTAGGASLYDALLAPAAAEPALVHAVGERLEVIPADTDMAAVESELAGEPNRHARLQRLLARLAVGRDVVLIDCPPSLGLLTVNGLVAASRVIIPMQAHYLALQGVGKLLETVAALRAGLNPSLRVDGVVLCMHDTSSTHCREVVAEMEAFFAQPACAGTAWEGAGVLPPPIRRNIKLAECPSFGKTIFDYAPGAPGAEDYAGLARGLQARWRVVVGGVKMGNPAFERIPDVVTRPTGPGAAMRGS